MQTHSIKNFGRVHRLNGLAHKSNTKKTTRIAFSLKKHIKTMFLKLASRAFETKGLYFRVSVSIKRQTGKGRPLCILHQVPEMTFQAK